nr:flagellar biosynthetic protein FliO [uncultured Desulfobacter sp.]
MNTPADLWMEFGKSFGMLFAVLFIFLLILYLVRRFSGRFGNSGSTALIKVLSVHHLSPKEKLMLVAVQEESILIGISPAGISSLARFDTLPEATAASHGPAINAKFQNLLKKSLMKNNTAQKMAVENDSPGSGNLSGQGEIS